MNRNSSIDIAKVVCAILIYFLHARVAKNFSHFFQSISENGLFIVAVPFFFIVTGYYFFNNIKTPTDLYKWCKTILLIYFSWMFLYFPFYYKESFVVYIFGFWHLWYLNALLLGGITLYAIKDMRYCLVAVVVIAIIGIIIQYARCMMNLSFIPFYRVVSHDFFTRNFLFFALPYLYLGWVINKYKIQNIIKEKVVVVLLIIASILVVIECALQPILISNEIFSKDLLFSNLIFIPVLLIFCLTRNIEVEQKNKRKLRDFSTVFFLVHPLAIIMTIHPLTMKVVNGFTNDISIIFLQIGITISLIQIVYIVKKYVKFIF